MTEKKVPDLSALIKAGFSPEAAATHIAVVVGEWGESFAQVAENPRFTFGAGEVYIQLWKPIQTSEGEALQLTMREPTLAELQKIDNVRGGMAQAQKLIVSTCSITEREAGMMGLRDLTLFGALAQAFTGAAPAIGE